MLVELFLSPFIFFVLFIVFLASLGKSVGIRRLYVNILLRIFEYGRVNIETATKLKWENNNVDVNDGSDAEDEADFRQEVPLDKDSPVDSPPMSPRPNGLVKKPSLNGLMNGMPNGGFSVISRESLILVPDADNKNGNGSTETTPEPKTVEINGDSDEEPKEKTLDFKLSNCLEYVKAGIEAIIEDDVTSRFQAEELKNWNLLTRTNRRYEFISWRLTVMWVMGFFMRYTVLMPLRVIICFIGTLWLTFCTGVVGCIPNSPTKRWLIRITLLQCFEFLSTAISSVVNYHNAENRPVNGICVANHTSPIDVLVLMCDNCYSLIGQRHGGFLGVLQRALARASPHIWFERAEAKDRSAVAQRLRQHVSNPDNPPILIFPEGTCINNTSVMQFKKGSFEVGGVIYPVAIKYDARFGDAFWNSSEYSMMQYLYMMMTSWAIVCDVWYLPPMFREEGESAIDFANRVKSVIAKQGGLVDLVWDGQLKRMKPKKEWKEKQQEEFSKRLKGD